MYISTKVPTEFMAEDTWTMIHDYKKALVKHCSNGFPARQHLGNLPALEVKIDWAKGGNYITTHEGRAKEDTSHRKVPIFVYDAKHKECIKAVIMECKKNKHEREVFGEHDFWQYKLEWMMVMLIWL